MKSSSAIVAIISTTLLVTGCNSQSTSKKAELNTDDQKFSYGIGISIERGMKQDGVVIDEPAFAEGLKDGQAGAKSQLDEAEVQRIVTAKNKEMMEKRQKQMEEAGAKSKTESDAFLAANKSKPGVQTTASGLQYKVIKPGNGKKPAATSVVTVNYRGTLVDGTQFDASNPSSPAVFPLNRVIPGWTEGIQLMNEGSTYEFYIPSNLAYGLEGAGGGRIPGNAALIFNVDLLKVADAPPAPGATPALDKDKAPAKKKK